MILRVLAFLIFPALVNLAASVQGSNCFIVVGALLCFFLLDEDKVSDNLDQTPVLFIHFLALHKERDETV